MTESTEPQQPGAESEDLDESPEESPGDETSGEETPGEEPVGSAAEEAMKLFGAVTDWARTQAGEGNLAGQAAAVARELQEHVGRAVGGSEECRFCPICRAINAVRETNPEVKHNLFGAASNLMQAAAAFLEPPEHTRRADAEQDPEAGRTGTGTTMEHIDLDPDTGDDS